MIGLEKSFGMMYSNLCLNSRETVPLKGLSHQTCRVYFGCMNSSGLELEFSKGPLNNLHKILQCIYNNLEPFQITGSISNVSYIKVSYSQWKLPCPITLFKEFADMKFT